MKPRNQQIRDNTIIVTVILFCSIGFTCANLKEAKEKKEQAQPSLPSIPEDASPWRSADTSLYPGITLYRKDGGAPYPYIEVDEVGLKDASGRSYFTYYYTGTHKEQRVYRDEFSNWPIVRDRTLGAYQGDIDRCIKGLGN